MCSLKHAKKIIQHAIVLSVPVLLPVKIHNTHNCEATAANYFPPSEKKKVDLVLAEMPN